MMPLVNGALSRVTIQAAVAAFELPAQPARQSALAHGGGVSGTTTFQEKRHHPCLRYHASGGFGQLRQPAPEPQLRYAVAGVGGGELLKNLAKLVMRTIIDPEATLEDASTSAKAGGPSGALKVVLIVSVVVVMVVVLAILTAHFPDLDFEGR